LVSALPLDEPQIARAADEMIAEYGDEALSNADVYFDCQSASEIADLWSEETGRSAFEIREDLETWLEAFGQEDTLSRDDQLLRLMGVRWVDRASLLTYCRNRGLEFPEFWFSETIAREKSTGRRSDGPEPGHIAFPGSNKGSDRGIELSPTSTSESLELVVRDDLMPGGENTDENVNPRLVAEQLELNRITKARLVSRRLFTWGPALIVAFGVALVVSMLNTV
jgi:hypothetical protein